MAVEPAYLIEKQSALARPCRIEGQIRGLQRLVDENRSCIEILTQVSAATKALEGVALQLLDQHLRHCLANATDPVEAQQELTEASEAIRRLVRSGTIPTTKEHRCPPQTAADHYSCSTPALLAAAAARDAAARPTPAQPQRGAQLQRRPRTTRPGRVT